MKVLIDSYAWVELFLGSGKGVKVRELVDTAEEAFTPDTVLAELTRKYFREGSSEKLVRERLATIQATSHILTVTADVAVAASGAYFELADRARKKRLASPSLFDGIVLGAARVRNAKVVTGDSHFEDLAETIWI